MRDNNPLCPDTYSNVDNGALLWENDKAEFHASLQEEVNRGHKGRWYSMKLPIELAVMNGLEKIMASVTLIRRDDWYSLCLLEDIEIDVLEYYDYQSRRKAEHLRMYRVSFLGNAAVKWLAICPKWTRKRGS